MSTRSKTSMRAAAAAVSVLATLGAGGGVAGAADAKDVLQLTALTGPNGGDVTITVPAAEGGGHVSRFEHVHVRLVAAAGSDAPDRVVNRKDVAAQNGVGKLALGDVARGTKVEVQVHVRESNPPRTSIMRGDAIAKLRPDLVVAAVRADAQTLSTRAVDVVAEVSERNGDTGATATLRLMLGPTPLADPKTVTVAANGTSEVTFAGVKLETAMTAELTVRVENAAPFETDATNNTRNRTIEVTEHELVRSKVLVPTFGGYGAQFNQHVYAPITGAPPESLPAMERTAKELAPQLVRIFYNDRWEERLVDAPQNLASFYRTVQLAHDAGATINITYHAVDVAKTIPGTAMARFAGVLDELVRVRGNTNVRWVTVGNEPNSTILTLPQYEALYRALHDQLVARGLRDQIRIMGGDLVESGAAVGSNHRNWFNYMVEHMNDIVDAYSVHIYWNFHNIPRMEFRLKDVHQVVTQELAPEGRKPTYIMEFAVRGRDPFPAKPTPRHGFYDDGTEMRKTNIAAFQTLWFFIASAQLGYTGTAKWDAYWGMYDTSSPGNQSYWLTGTAAEGWPLFPTYHSLRLLLQTTQRGWEVVQVGPWDESDWKVGVADQQEKELVAYAGSGGALTVMGLDTHARFLNTVSAESSTYSLGGLPPNASFSLALWNASGNGENSIAGTVTTNAAGVARFEVPLHAAFSLTNVPMS